MLPGSPAELDAMMAHNIIPVNDFLTSNLDKLEGIAFIVAIAIWLAVFISSVGYLVLPWYLFWRLDRIQRTLDALSKSERNPFK